MEYLRILLLTVIYRIKNLFTKAFQETQPAVVAYFAYTQKQKYTSFWTFVYREKILVFFTKFSDRQKFPGLHGGSDLDNFYDHIRSRTYQSGFQVAMLLFYFWLHQLLSNFWVNALAVILLSLIVLKLMASKPGWLTTVFHMGFYIACLKQLFQYLDSYEIITLIYLYNFFLRTLVETSLELLIQPLLKFNIIWFVYHRIIKKINKN